ncbi:MAG TPA: hypothetical protein PK948_02440 [Gemmatimonadales bacterium]|nr:hypothetical protein [Gemmatimonadales bacterium]
MYRIRLASGQEQVYRSIQELTAGVQRGEVTAESEIYHQRTERWLSIESHPHYRMAVDGGTATRQSRLKFTRPSSPIANTGVRPTPPAAGRPDQGDLEELNRLLVLLDPLPTPAQRAEPPMPAVQSPPDLTLIRPEPVPLSMSSDDPQPSFGTMLRLEDLDPAPPSTPPAPIAPPVVEIIRDERPVHEDAVAPVVEAPVVEPVATLSDVAPSDLGLPVEIHLDEIPVPVELEPIAIEEAFRTRDTAPPMDVAPVSFAPVAAAAPAVAFLAAPAHSAAEDSAAPARSPRRPRPMLFVAVAAILALAVFAFTGGSTDPDQSIVTLASATAPSAVAQPAPVDSSLPASGQGVGFPLPTPGTVPKGPATDPRTATTRDSNPPAAVLPSAPTIDLGSSGAEMVDAGAAAPRADAGSGAALARGYTRSYAALETEFAAQMDRSGLVRLFSQTQLTTADGLSGARRALDAAAAAVRQYHAKETTIERAYQDSARALERNGASAADLRDWMTHASLKESQEAAGESTRLIGQIDAVFALLQSQSGKYRIEGSTIKFDDSNAAARYSDLQSWITRRLEHWAGQPASAVPNTVQPLLEGIGLTRLPASR